MSDVEAFMEARRKAAAEPNRTDPVVDDRTFMANVREALGNGYDRCCATCGVGIYDESDIHERRCPEFVEWRS